MKARKGNYKGTGGRRRENKRNCRTGTRTMRMVEGNEVRRRQGGGTGRWLKAILACESPRVWVRVTCPTCPTWIPTLPLPSSRVSLPSKLQPLPSSLSPPPAFSPPLHPFLLHSLLTHLHSYIPLYLFSQLIRVLL